MGKPPKLLGTEALFATPLFSYEAPEFEALNVRLAEECLAIQRAGPGVFRSNYNGWHSAPDLFQRKEPALTALCQFLIASLSDVFRRTLRSGKPDSLRANCNGWININPKGAMNIPHTHPGYVWSGTYYVQIPRSSRQDNGSIEFLDPRTNANAVSGEWSPFQVKHRLAPKAGTALIFPSYLQHWVYPNDDEDLRISVAFNCRPIERGAPSPMTRQRA